VLYGKSEVADGQLHMMYKPLNFLPFACTHASHQAQEQQHIRTNSAVTRPKTADKFNLPTPAAWLPNILNR
jgi:hypothetical protein